MKDWLPEFVELCKHPAIAGKKGALLCGDEVYHHRYGISIFCEFCDEGQREVYESHIWLPKTEDREHPERGLWGMVDKTSRVDILWQSNNTVKVEIFNLWNQFCYSITGPLPIALAKAIIWQHERTK